MDEPTFEYKQSIHRLTVHADPFDETLHCPEASITEGRICFDQPLDAFRQDFVQPWRCRSNYRARPQPGTGKFQNSADSAHRYAGQRHYHSSDVERFFRKLKEECVGQHNFASFGEARTAITRWIEWYNAERPHQALGYRSPRQFRALQPQLAACH
jgi:Integrase core domain